jgi:hypothetical protein
MPHISVLRLTRLLILASVSCSPLLLPGRALGFQQASATAARSPKLRVPTKPSRPGGTESSAAAAPIKPYQQPGKFMGWRYAVKMGPEATQRFRSLQGRANTSRASQVLGTASTANAAAVLQSASSPSASLPALQIRPTIPAGSLPNSVAVGDFNGDKHIDWVISNGGDNSLTIYFGKGDGTSELPHIVRLLGQAPAAVAVADLNGDGKLDIAVAEADSATIGLLFGNGDGTFKAEKQIKLPVIPLAIAIADVNNDKKPDLLVATVGDGGKNNYELAALLNTGTGAFGSIIGTPTPFQGSGQSIGWNLSVADIDNDGNLDVIVSGQDFDKTTNQVFTGNGDGSFAVGALVDYGNGDPLLDLESPNAVFADIDSDGCMDVVDVDTYALVRVFHGDCKGNFDSNGGFLAFGVGDSGYGLAVADMNGDGHPDIVVGGVPQDVGVLGTLTGNTVSVCINDGTGHFGQSMIYRGEPGIMSLAVADLQENGHPAVITANQDSNSASVFLNDGTGFLGFPMGAYAGLLDGSTVDAVGNPQLSGYIAKDVTGDGIADLSVIQLGLETQTTDLLVVFPGLGGGKFGPPVRSPIWPQGGVVSDFILADLRNSGLPDFVGFAYNNTANGLNEVTYAKNLGNGKFGAPVETTFPQTNGGFFLGSLVAGDFNNDGNLDVAVVSATSSSAGPMQLDIFLGHGDGTLTHTVEYNFGPPNVAPWAVAMFATDANGDGKTDLYVRAYNNTFGLASVFPEQGRDVFQILGNGDGTFQQATEVVQSVQAPTLADVNKDGLLDVLDVETAPFDPNDVNPLGEGSPHLNVYMAKSGGSFAAPVTYAPYQGNLAWEDYWMTNGNIPGWFGDFNGDGKLDFAAYQNPGAVFSTDSGSTNSATYVQFMLGNGDGTFTPTYNSYNLNVHQFPDTVVPNAMGDGRGAPVETLSFTSSYQVFQPAVAAPFQIGVVEIPVHTNSDAITLTLNAPSSNATTFALTTSDPNVVIAANATIAAGQTSLQVPFTLNKAIDGTRWFSVSAESNGLTETTYDFPGLGQSSFVFTTATGSVNVTQGSLTQLFSAQIQSFGDATALFSVTCGGLPSGAACDYSFGSNMLSVPSGGTASTLFLVTAAADTPVGPFTLNVTATDGLTTQTIPIQMNVVEAPDPLQVGATEVNFQPQFDGTTSSSAQQFAISNMGANPVTSPTITGPANSNSKVGTFNQTNNCTGTIAVGGSCSVQVTYTAVSPGSVTDTISVHDSRGTVTVQLSASSMDFSIATAPGAPASATVTAGGTATYNIQLASHGYTGYTAMACTTTAPASKCAVSVQYGDLTTQTTATLSVSVTTTAPTAAIRKQSGSTDADDTERLSGKLALPVAALVAAMACWSVARKRRRLSLAAFSLATLLLLAASCGGGGGNSSGGGGGGLPPPNPGTPAGTYQVSVTASDQGQTRTLPLTLVVN